MGRKKASKAAKESLDVPVPTEAEPTIQPVEDRRYKSEGSDFAPYLWLLLFSSMMFTLPFAAFFGVKSVLEHRNMDTFTENCWCVFAAALTANFVIFLYVIKALHEENMFKNKKDI